MMFAKYLEASVVIMLDLNTPQTLELVSRMTDMVSEIKDGITKYGIVSHPQFGAMYAFEVDGYGSQVSISLYCPVTNKEVLSMGRISWMTQTYRLYCLRP